MAAQMTPQGDALSIFVDAVEQASSMTELEAQVRAIQRYLGFGHHFLSLHQTGQERRVILTDLVPDFHFRPGPIEVAATRRVRPFFWDSVNSRPQNRRGGSQMFIVPLNLPKAATGFCAWFLGERALERDAIAGGIYFAGSLFEQMRRLDLGDRQKVGKLSRRQRDCVRLAARGKSDWVASQLLGLQPDTVHKYLEQAKTRYGVSTRTELVVRALYEGELHFHELLD